MDTPVFEPKSVTNDGPVIANQATLDAFRADGVDAVHPVSGEPLFRVIGYTPHACAECAAQGCDTCAHAPPLPTPRWLRDAPRSKRLELKRIDVELEIKTCEARLAGGNTTWTWRSPFRDTLFRVVLPREEFEIRMRAHLDLLRGRVSYLNRLIAAEDDSDGTPSETGSDIASGAGDA